MFVSLISLYLLSIAGGTRDYLVLGSDSGRVSIVQWSAASNRFVKVHEETYGKSSVRRMVPGQYVACDPKGRALMLAAFEKQKLVYVLNRDQAANLTISSPLEAHKSHMITLSIVALDVSFDNPIFAALEADPNDEPSAEEQAAYAASGATAVSGPLVHKYLTFYELDLGLNHVTRSYSQQVDSGANLLLSVPGGESGPGGVLICAENAVYYKSADHSDELHRTYLRAPFPKRFGFDSNEKGTLITSATSHVQKGLFFFLLQSEYGDLYKISLNYEEDTVSEMTAKYFDTIPVSNAMVVLKTGFLFNASEGGNAYLWQFQGIGDEDDPTPFTSSKHSGSAASAAAASAEEDDSAVIFKPRVPTNLALVDDMEVGAPILDFRVADLAREYTPQIYTLVGRGARSSLRVLRHGLAVSEIAVSELPGAPLGVWALKRQAADAFMSYIVVSFVGATIVLSIGETVAEVKDSGILGESNTIHVALLADDSIVQIHPRGMRRISKDRRIHEWKTPVNKEITFAACNERQIVLALKNELIYFELDMSSDAASAVGGAGGNLVDVQRKDMGTDVAAIAIAPIPEGRVRASFLSVALFNNTVRILSLDPSQTLSQVAMQAVTAQPTSLALVSMNTMAGSDSASGGSSSSSAATTNLYLYIGLTNGILMRSLMDESAGSLSDTRKRFLGTKPVKLHQVRLRESNAVVALSSRNWLSYIHASRFQMVPLSYDLLEFGAAFSSEQCPEGIVCLSASSLRIVTLERLGSMFNQSVLALKNTPRRMAVHPVTNQIVLIETDHNAYTEKQKIELRQTMREMEAATAEESMDLDGADGVSSSSSNAARVKAEMQAAADPALNEAFMGAPHAGEGAWASSIRIVDPVRLDTLALLSLEDNEAAFSLQILQFGANPAWFLVVGTAQNLVLAPRSLTSGFLHVYAFSADGSSLSFLHKTAVKDVPLALGAFHKKLAVGVGRCLRLYDLGQKQLLRKCENKNFPQAIQSLTISAPGQGSPDRIYVGDLCEGFAIVLYKKSTNELEIVADSTAPRYLTAQALLDIDTMVGGDKFGNLFVSRLNAEISKQFLSGSSSSSSEQTIATLMNKYGKVLQGAQHKLSDIANFYVGETITALQKVALVPGSSEVVLYATLQGGLGILLPFTSREDVEFFTHLEMHLRQEAASSSLVGRDHLSYRGYYFPVKNVVDGDLCEMFSTHLPAAKQESVAEELVCTAQEVAKRMEDLRNRVL